MSSLARFPIRLNRVFVMAGFMPAIHAFTLGQKDADGRERQGVTPVCDGLWRGHDDVNVIGKR